MVYDMERQSFQLRTLPSLQGRIQKSAKTQHEVKGTRGTVLKPGIHNDVKSGRKIINSLCSPVNRTVEKVQRPRASVGT